MDLAERRNKKRGSCIATNRVIEHGLRSTRERVEFLTFAEGRLSDSVFRPIDLIE